MLDLRTGKEMTRRDALKGLAGIGAILASGAAPAILRHDLEMRIVAMAGGKLTANDYIQDGLQYQWDALELGNSVSNKLWTDLKHGTKLVSPWGRTNEVDFSAQGMVRFLAYRYGFSYTFNGSECTIEFCGIDSWSTASDALYFQVNSNTHGYYSVVFGSRDPSSEYGNAPGSLETGRYDTTRALVLNGTNCSYLRSDTFARKTFSVSTVAGTYYFCIGKDTSSQTSNLRAIRFYNRALSDSEILYNHNLDKARFGLP